MSSRTAYAVTPAVRRAVRLLSTPVARRVSCDTLAPAPPEGPVAVG